MANEAIGDFLKHDEPVSVIKEYKDLAGAVAGPLKWGNQRLIASGEKTHRTEWEEAQYYGNYSAPALAEWLSQFDSSWEVDVSDYGGDIYVVKETRIPYTEEEIAAAKKYIEEHPNPDTEYIRFRVNHD